MFYRHTLETILILYFKNYYPRFVIQNGGLVYTYDFPGRVRGDQWHTLQCQKTSNTVCY
jgi:hypothetical protein